MAGSHIKSSFGSMMDLALGAAIHRHHVDIFSKDFLSSPRATGWPIDWHPYTLMGMALRV